MGNQRKEKVLGKWTEGFKDEALLTLDLEEWVHVSVQGMQTISVYTVDDSDTGCQKRLLTIRRNLQNTSTRLQKCFNRNHCPSSKFREKSTKPLLQLSSFF